MPPSTSITDVGDRVASEDAAIRPFRVAIPQDELDDLRRHINAHCVRQRRS
jgi:hypothetical protein